jgi:hypothetical protein
MPVALVLMLRRSCSRSQPRPKAKPTNPGDKIGSRLGVKKVCRTAAQWQEWNDIEKVRQVVNQAPSG